MLIVALTPAEITALQEAAQSLSSQNDRYLMIVLAVLLISSLLYAVRFVTNKFLEAQKQISELYSNNQKELLNTISRNTEAFNRVNETMNNLTKQNDE